jgi:hypothetical protein
MVKARVAETDNGIQGSFDVAAYDRMMRKGLLSSIHAAYTAQEILGLLRDADLPQPLVRKNLLGLMVSGVRA